MWLDWMACETPGSSPIRSGWQPTSVAAWLVESSKARSSLRSFALVAALPYVVAGLLGHSGGGDLKLAFVVGGLSADPATALLVVGLAQLVALVGFVTERRRLRPHGPALSSVAAILVVGPTFS